MSSTTNTAPVVGDIITGRCVTMNTEHTGRVAAVIEPQRGSGDSEPRYRIVETGEHYSSGAPVEPIVWLTAVVERVSTPTIAERVNHRNGRREFRAYPAGTRSRDGGSGPWTPDREAAESILADALAIDAERDDAAHLADVLAVDSAHLATQVRDHATAELRRADLTEATRRWHVARLALARAELARRTHTVTGYDSIGRTVTLHVHGADVGRVSYFLDRDPGAGSMSGTGSADAFTITGGDAETVARIAEWADQQTRGPWHRSDAPGAVAFRAWAADVAHLADELAGAGEAPVLDHEREQYDAPATRDH